MSISAEPAVKDVKSFSFNSSSVKQKRINNSNTDSFITAQCDPLHCFQCKLSPDRTMHSSREIPEEIFTSIVISV